MGRVDIGFKSSGSLPDHVSQKLIKRKIGSVGPAIVVGAGQFYVVHCCVHLRHAICPSSTGDQEACSCGIFTTGLDICLGWKTSILLATCSDPSTSTTEVLLG